MNVTLTNIQKPMKFRESEPDFLREKKILKHQVHLTSAVDKRGLLRTHWNI